MRSFGTRVAQCFAYYRPGRIGRAVFTGTSIPHGTSPEERARSVEARARMIERGGDAVEIACEARDRGSAPGVWQQPRS